jgi:S-adenosylmethionine synthetase
MALAYSHRLVQRLAEIRKHHPELKPYLRPDAKSQVTIEYSEDHKPLRIETVVVSTQHDEFITPEVDTDFARVAADEAMLKQIHDDILKHVIKEVLPADMLVNTNYHINPTGKFVIGGPHGDSGLTGRKIIVDTYGGKGAHGGGAFSGKDSSKVDRSAAYAARHIAKNLVAAGVASEILVQVAYAIGVAQPVSINVNTYGTANIDLHDGEIASKVAQMFDMRPKAIVERLGLKNPIFSPTAAYGHMGRTPETVTKTFKTPNGEEKTITVELFTWEKLDYLDKVKAAFGI